MSWRVVFSSFCITGIYWYKWNKNVFNLKPLFCSQFMVYCVKNQCSWKQRLWMLPFSLRLWRCEHGPFVTSQSSSNLHWQRANKHPKLKFDAPLPQCNSVAEIEPYETYREIVIHFKANLQLCLGSHLITPPPLVLSNACNLLVVLLLLSSLKSQHFLFLNLSGIWKPDSLYSHGRVWSKWMIYSQNLACMFWVYPLLLHILLHIHPSSVGKKNCQPCCMLENEQSLPQLLPTVYNQLQHYFKSSLLYRCISGLQVVTCLVHHSSVWNNHTALWVPVVYPCPF